MAARNCRKRKIDQIKQLEDDVGRIRNQKGDLIREHERLMAQRTHWTDMVKRLHDHVLKVHFSTNNNVLKKLKVITSKSITRKTRHLLFIVFLYLRSWDMIQTFGSSKWIIIDRFIFYLEVSHKKRTHQR